jgi:hypothetical protein
MKLECIRQTKGDDPAGVVDIARRRRVYELKHALQNVFPDLSENFEVEFEGNILKDRYPLKYYKQLQDNSKIIIREDIPESSPSTSTPSSAKSTVPDATASQPSYVLPRAHLRKTKFKHQVAPDPPWVVTYPNLESCVISPSQSATLPSSFYPHYVYSQQMGYSFPYYSPYGTSYYHVPPAQPPYMPQAWLPYHIHPYSSQTQYHPTFQWGAQQFPVQLSNTTPNFGSSEESDLPDEILELVSENETPSPTEGTTDEGQGGTDANSSLQTLERSEDAETSALFERLGIASGADQHE